MNSLNLVGRLTKKPELARTQTGKILSKFTIAINRIGQEETDFINCIVWGVQAENLVKYQDKGGLIAVNGSLRIDQYQDKDGKNQSKTYALVNNIEYLQSKTSEKSSENPYEDFGNAISVDDNFLE